MTMYRLVFLLFVAGAVLQMGTVEAAEPVKVKIQTDLAYGIISMVGENTVKNVIKDQISIIVPGIVAEHILDVHLSSVDGNVEMTVDLDPTIPDLARKMAIVKQTLKSGISITVAGRTVSTVPKKVDIMYPAKDYDSSKGTSQTATNTFGTSTTKRADDAAETINSNSAAGNNGSFQTTKVQTLLLIVSVCVMHVYNMIF